MHTSILPGVKAFIIISIFKPMAKQNFFQELKRRNVYRVAVTYAVVAWLLIQVVSAVVPMLEAPAWVGKSVLILLLVGFPIALILAWAFEMSPEGIVKTTSSAAKKNPLPYHKKKPFTNNIIIGALVLVIAGQFIYNRYSSLENKEGIELSIAVLPFDNLSEEKDMEFFSDGVSRNMINNLSIIKDFLVVPYSSVEKYKVEPVSAEQVGTELEVHYVVEGFVERSEETIAVSVSLSDAALNKQIWTSGRIQRSLGVENLFEIQNNITQSISDKLKTTILPEEQDRLDNIPTLDQVAYDYYLQGENFREQYGLKDYVHNKEVLEKAELFYNLALERDSTLAEAYVGLGNIRMMGSNFYATRLEADALQDVITLTEKALAFNTKLVEAYTLRYWVYINRTQRDLAQSACNQIYDLFPNHIDALGCQLRLAFDKMDLETMFEILPKIEKQLNWENEDPSQPIHIMDDVYGDIFGILGDLDLQSYFAERAHEKDSTQGIPWYPHLYKNDVAEAIKHFKLMVKVPNQLYFHRLGSLHSYAGEFDEALEYFKQWEALMKEEDPDNWFSFRDNHRYAYVLIMTGHEERGMQMLDEQIALFERSVELKNSDYFSSMYDLSAIYSFIGNEEKSLYWFEKLVNEENAIWNVAGIVLDYWTMVDPLMTNMLDNMKFQELLNQVTVEREAKRIEARNLLGIKEVPD